VRVIWSPSALNEVQRIYDYVADLNPSAAGRLIQDLLAAGNGLELFPNRGRRITDMLRELTTIYPYIIRYEISRDEVRILRVRHGACRP
jgi:toxin ParE1/3/4